MYLNLIRVDFKSDGSIGSNVSGFVLVVIFIQLLVELADVIWYRAVSRRRLVACFT